LRPAVCGCSGIVSVGPSLSIAEPAAASLDLFDGIPANVRDVVTLDKEFLASVAEHGVLTPITAVRRGDTVEVTDGQRRTLAARQVGLRTVPVYLREVNTDETALAVERVV